MYQGIGREYSFVEEVDSEPDFKFIEDRLHRPSHIVFTSNSLIPITRHIPEYKGLVIELNAKHEMKIKVTE